MDDGTQNQKNPRVRKIRVRNSGAGNGCANFMDAWKKCVRSAGKTMSIKFLVLGGGAILGFGGGGCRFYFYGREDLSENCPKSDSSRKWLGEGAKGLLDPASKRPLALVRNGVAPVQKRVSVVQKTLGRPLLPGPKRVKKTFGTLP